MADLEPSQKPTIDEILDESELVETHLHPPSQRINPSARFRRGGITFAGAGAALGAGTNIIVGYTGSTVTYSVVAALGAPGAGVVHVLVQATLDLTIRKIADAMQGVVDAVNIAYGAGTQPHPNTFGYYTSQRFTVGSTAHPAGSSIMFKERTADVKASVSPYTLSTTGNVGASGVTTNLVRVYNHRYVFNNNAAAPNNPGDNIAGDMQTIIPMKSVLDSSLIAVRYDIDGIVVEAVNTTSEIIEADLYYSTDEVTFYNMDYGVNLSKDVATQGSQQVVIRGARLPTNAGLYTKMRASGVSNTSWVDFKVQMHQYPAGM